MLNSFEMKKAGYCPYLESFDGFQSEQLVSDPQEYNPA